MGGRSASAPRHGHASISDDGSGNLVVAADKQILFGGDNDDSSPHIARQTGADTGIRFMNDTTKFVRDAGLVFQQVNGRIETSGRLEVEGKLAWIAGATQSITGVSGVVTASAAVVKISADGNYTLTSTPTIAAGVDGQMLIIENVGTNTVAFQDEAVKAGTLLQLDSNSNQALGAREMLQLIYSSDEGAWLQINIKSENT